MEQLLQLDKKLFIFINQGLANPITDFIMPILTNGKNWMPVYIGIFIYLIFVYQKSTKHNNYSYFEAFVSNKKGLIIALVLALGVILSDQISATFIKEWVGRLRPCKTMDVNLLVNCGSGKSFPSAHATNNFLAASILSFYFRKWRYLFYLIAGLIALSRVFVGVHYPIDITVGGILGFTIGSILIFFARKLFPFYHP